MADYRRECDQCSYTIPERHRRCSLRTCERFPYCWIHMKKVYGLVVKTSGIRNAGLGLFFMGYKKPNGAMVDALRIGSTVTHYSSETLTNNADYNAKYGDADTDYGFLTNGGWLMDSGSTMNFPGRLINDAHGTRKHNNVAFPSNRAKPRFNAEFGRFTIPIKAIRRINAGDELFIRYGAAYWEED